MFHFLTGINRPTSPTNIAKIRASIVDGGCFRDVLVARINFIDGSYKHYIIDGQNLFIALMSLEMDIPYKVHAISDMKELITKMAQINTAQRRWGTEDFINGWKNDNPVYFDLMKAHHLYNLSYSSVAALMLDVSSLDRGKNAIQEGSLHIVNSEYKKVANYLVELLEATEEKRYVPISERFVTVFLQYYNSETYDHEATLLRAVNHRDLVLHSNLYNLTNLLVEKVFV